MCPSVDTTVEIILRTTCKGGAGVDEEKNRFNVKLVQMKRIN